MKCCDCKLETLERSRFGLRRVELVQAHPGAAISVAVSERSMPEVACVSHEHDAVAIHQ